MAGTIIYGILFGIATVMIFMATWRLLFLGSYKEADPMAIDALVASWKRGEALVARGQLGWLEPLINDAMGEFVPLRKSVEEFRRRTERFHPTLVVAANAAMGVGFLGTVVSMASTVGGNVDPVMIIGLGMQSTMVGLIIALPGSAFHGVTDNKVMRFLDQVDAVLEALDGRINPPTAPVMYSPPNSDPPTNGNGRCVSRQVAGPETAKSQKGPKRASHIVQDEITSVTKQNDNSESETNHDGGEDEAQRHAVAMIASSPEFDNMVMGILNEGDVQND